MKTITKTALALVAIIAAAIISLSATAAWADGENIVTGPSEGMCVTHTMFTNSAASETGITYTVNFTPITSNVDSGFTTTGHAAIAPVVFTPLSDSADVTSSEWTRHYTKQVVLPAATSFPHAGAWMYEISETASGAAATDSTKWTNSNATYKMRVYIENDDVNGGLKYGAWSVERIDANDGTALAEPEKVDATYPPTTTSGLLFSSQYIKNQTLTITKEVEGSFADKTHEFPISVKLTLPDWYHDPTSADPAPSISYTDTSNTAQTGTPVYNSSNGTWELIISDGYAHSHSLTATVPVGTRYAIDETNPNAAGLTYTPSITWNVGLPPYLTYDANGGTGSVAPSPAYSATGKAEVANGSGLTAPTEMKTFYCWNTAADGSGTDYFPGDEIDLAANTPLYARYTNSQVTVNYYGWSEETGTDTRVVLDTRTFSLDDQFVNFDSSFTGYCHNGWYTTWNKLKRKAIANDGTIRDMLRKYDATNGLKWDGTSSVDIYADQSMLQIFFHYDANGGPFDGPSNWSYWDDKPYQGGITWEGEVFSNWALDREGTIDVTGMTASEIVQAANSAGIIHTMAPENITLYAVWTHREYTVTYHFGYDNLTDTATASGHEGYNEQAWIYRDPPIRSGYAFIEWNTASDGTGQTALPDSLYGNTFQCADTSTERNLYAQWGAVNGHYLTLDANDGSASPAATQIEMCSDYRLPTCSFTAPSNKAFALWNTASDGSGTYYRPGDQVAGDADMALYAIWIPSVITVEYWGVTSDNVYGDSVFLHSEQVPVGNKFVSWQAPHINGYSWTGNWFDGDIGLGDEIDQNATMLEITRDYLTNGKPWYPEPWDGSGSLKVWSNGAYYENKVTLHVVLPDDPHAPTLEDKEIYWTNHTGWGGGYAPTFVGNYFIGWYEDADFTTPIDAGNLSMAEMCAQLYAHGVVDTPEPQEITVYGKYAPYVYTVTYDYQYDGITDTATNFGYAGFQGDAWIYRDAQRNGYTFNGWNTKADGTGLTIDASTKYSRLVGGHAITSTILYAQWAPA